MEFFEPRAQRTTARVVRCDIPMVISLSWPIMRTLERVCDENERIRLTKKALKEDRGCILANMEMANRAESIEEKLRYLYRAVHAGDELWEPVADELGPRMRWWQFQATRPYMEAMFKLGEALMEAGEDDEAKELFERLLAMDPKDNLYVEGRTHSGSRRLGL